MDRQPMFQFTDILQTKQKISLDGIGVFPIYLAPSDDSVLRATGLPVAAAFAGEFRPPDYRAHFEVG